MSILAALILASRRRLRRRFSELAFGARAVLADGDTMLSDWNEPERVFEIDGFRR